MRLDRVSGLGFRFRVRLSSGLNGDQHYEYSCCALRRLFLRCWYKVGALDLVRDGQGFATALYRYP